jgi:HAD superfamily hydrolase (TIGR01490 family)
MTDGIASGRITAFFDFDRTLIGVNSGRLWVDAERRAGRISRWQLAAASLMFLRYHLSLIDMVEAMNKAISTVAGEPEQDLAERTRQWYAEEVRPHLLPRALQTLEQHREQGHALVLLTTSSPYLSRAVTQDLRLDDYGCTAFEVDEAGRFTGQVVEPVCYGPGKVEHALRIASRHGLDVDASYFYTDSYTDRAMLKKVAHPRVVNPDPRLRRLARQKGWQVLDWGAG